MRRRRIIEGIATLNMVRGRSRLMQQERDQIQPRHETIFVGPMLDRLLGREPEAVRKFVESFTPAIIRIITTITGAANGISPAERLEYLQDCFGKIFEKLPAFDKTLGVRFESWAWAVASNLMRDEVRRRRSRRYGSEASIDESIGKFGDTLAGPASAEPERILLASREGTHLEAALRTISGMHPRHARDCQILLLELELYRSQVKPTVKVLADRLGCDPSTITRSRQRWSTSGFLELLHGHLKKTGVLP